MKRIERDSYLKQLISRRNNGRVKVITGIRRCGKSYLLFDIYGGYLRQSGVSDDQFITLRLDEAVNARYRSPLELDQYVRAIAQAAPDREHYVFIDEVQEVRSIANPWLPGTDDKIGFVDVLLGLMNLSNVDIYVTGSNSRMLSADIMTQFRDRGDEIHVNPLTYREFYEAFQGDKHDAWHQFTTYGGLPRVMDETSHEDKSRYLTNLMRNTYLADVVERNHLRGSIAVLDQLLDVVASGVGSLTNPARLSNTLRSEAQISISDSTISAYLGCLEEAFLVSKAHRYDIKGRRYIGSPLKYYFTDVGLRNAQLNFRQQDEGHLMENVVYNELRARGYNVDVGVVPSSVTDADGRTRRTSLEVDFVVNMGSNRCYIQSAYAIPDEAKRQQETQSLSRIDDSFQKVVVVRNRIIPWHDERGIYYIGVEDFVLNRIDHLN